MGTKLYVGNLPFSATEEDLRPLFEQHGPVVSISVITDRDTGRSRGFAFVEMEAPAGAEAAISALDGQEFEGRALRVNPAHERGGSQRGRGGGGGGGGRSRW